MKWIGEHIWDFVSRLRNKVYLEFLESSSELCTLVVDSDGYVTKNCVKPNVVPANPGTYDEGRVPISTSTTNLYETVKDFRLRKNAGQVNKFNIQDPTLSTSSPLGLTGDGQQTHNMSFNTAWVNPQALTGSNKQCSIWNSNDLIGRAGNLPLTQTLTMTGKKLTVGSMSGSNAGSNTMTMMGLDLSLTNIVTGHAGDNIGQRVTIVDLRNALASQTNYKTTGLLINTPNDVTSTDLKIESAADPEDYFSIKTTTSGQTTIKTVDSDNGYDADLQIEVDGTLTVKDQNDLVYEVNAVGTYGNHTIKVMPNEFMVNDDAADAGGSASLTFDNDLGTMGVKISNVNSELVAFVKIPKGMKATHARVFGTRVSGSFTSNACSVYTYSYSDGTRTSSGTYQFNMNAFTDITDINAGSSSDLCLVVAPDSNTDVIHGASITLASI